MVNESSDDRTEMISARYPPSTLLIGVVPSLLFFAAWLFLPSESAGRVPWIILLVLLFMVPTVAMFVRVRVRLTSDVLSVRGIIVHEHVWLPRLTEVAVRQKRSGYRGGQYRWWQVVLRDADGGHIELSFNGFRVRDSARILAGIKPYVLAAGVRRDGPVDQALDGSLWWSMKRTPHYQAEHGSR